MRMMEHRRDHMGQGYQQPSTASPVPQLARLPIGINATERQRRKVALRL